jgi:hypothetical protein
MIAWRCAPAGGGHAVPVTQPEEPSRYRHLPEPVRPEDAVETVDVSEHHEIETDSDERLRLLRQAGGV